MLFLLLAAQKRASLESPPFYLTYEYVSDDFCVVVEGA
jgi:hypothetical protein